MKKTISITLAIAMIFIMSACVYANNFNNTVTITPGGLDDTAEKNIKSILGGLQWIGYLVAIGMIIWVGIKYLMSGAAEKAKAKETLVPIVIGAVLVAGATWIASALFNMLG